MARRSLYEQYTAIRANGAQRIRRRNPETCYDPSTGTLVGEPFDGVEVQLIGIDASGQALVRHESLPNMEAYFPICPDDDDRLVAPTDPGGLDLNGCCIDPQTGIIRCPGGEQQWYMHGRTVPLELVACFMQNGQQICEIAVADSTFRLPPCTQPDLIPPPGGEQICCYDVATGTLLCDGAWNGLKVSLLAMQAGADGSIVALVMSEELRPNSTMTFPICDDPVVNCCYDPATETLSCPGSDLDGTPAGLVAAWTSEDGQVYVWATWAGGGARMPLCPGDAECPPVFCCINLQTFELVCPGKPEFNATKADVVDFLEEGGYTWGVLADGTRIPTCGQKCPPPQLCPDCPTCPPGQFLSPDGSCSEPEVPQCPPGTLLDTTTMQCVHCPTCPPQDEPCCDDCAKGHECSGCDEGQGGGPMRLRHAGPMRNPDAGSRYRSTKRRHLFSRTR